jgi:hypothetical protein
MARQGGTQDLKKNKGPGSRCRNPCSGFCPPPPETSPGKRPTRKKSCGVADPVKNIKTRFENTTAQQKNDYLIV